MDSRLQGHVFVFSLNVKINPIFYKDWCVWPPLLSDPVSAAVLRAFPWTVSHPSHHGGVLPSCFTGEERAQTSAPTSFPGALLPPSMPAALGDKLSFAQLTGEQ